LIGVPGLSCGHNGAVPTRFLISVAETSFLAYLHYLDDIADVIAGRYGRGIDGVYQSLRLHPPVLALADAPLAEADLPRVAAELQGAWRALAIVDNAVDPEVYDRQANAVLPEAGVRAVVAAGRALAAAMGDDVPDDDEAIFGYLGDLSAEELLPYPWSAFCSGCPQLGTAEWGGSVIPGDLVSVFAPPDASTSDARLALLLRTTRQRVLERVFAVQRQTDVKPGRSRRNLSAELKEAIAHDLPPTTVFDVMDRVHRRAQTDDGLAFVEGAFDDEEARQFGTALAAVADASVAALEAVVAALIGWDLFADLAASHARRSPASAAARRRARALTSGP
jgi:hypothetical protein